MGRPRDIVAFAIFAKEAAVANGHARIEAADIYEGEKEYSKHILGELRDEVERHVADYTAVTNSIKTSASGTSPRTNGSPRASRTA